MSHKALNTKVKKPEQLALDFAAIDKVLATEDARSIADIQRDISASLERQESLILEDAHFDSVQNAIVQQPAQQSHFNNLPDSSQLNNSEQNRAAFDSKQIKVRYSMRAKRMSISVGHNGEVEMIVPGRKYRKPSLKRIRDFAAENKDWIEKTLKKYQQKAGQSIQSLSRPTKLDLKYIDQIIPIHYSDAINSQKKSLQERDGQLYIANNISDLEVATKLGKWLAKKAKQSILPELERLSKLTELKYKKASIRGQKSRWGSCSSRGNISLNYCILFLPKNFGDYVLIHELCHLEEFNHSRAFWRLVKRFEPNYKRIDRSINDLWMQLPRWLDLRFQKNISDETVYINL